MQTYQSIATSKQDRILTIKLSRPEKLNAVSAELHTELSHVFADAAEEPDADLIIFTGEGRAFCAGGDLPWIKRMHRDSGAVPGNLREARKVLLDILNLDVPIIAAVNGDAIGLGATLALFCDIIVAVDTAHFGDPHVRVGLVAGDGGAVIWPMALGPARAKEYLMTGNLLTAVEAERIGLINHAVPQDQLWPTVDKLTKALLANPQQAVRWTKRAVNKQVLETMNLVFDMSNALECLSFGTEDMLEAVTALIEKRRPTYTGR